MLLTVAVAVVLLSGQAAVAPEQRANDLYQAQDWAGAVQAYGALAAAAPAGPAAAPLHFRLAVSLMNVDRTADAIPHLMTAEKLGSPPMQVAVRLALAYARSNQRDAAFAQLTRAAGMGLTALPPPLDTDTAVTALRGDARYKAFEAALDRNARPCEQDPKYRELDFWLGEWNARNPNAPPNTPPASSLITKIHNGCVILETWRSPGYTGQSFNIYDRVRQKWHQTWVDSTGGLQEFWGELRDGHMVYEGTVPPPPGQTGMQSTRMTFFNQPGGTVRQLVERSADSGRTWQTTYDFIYTKK